MLQLDSVMEPCYAHSFFTSLPSQTVQVKVFHVSPSQGQTEYNC